MLKWPTEVFVYDYDAAKFVRAFDDVKRAKRFIVANSETELVLTFAKLTNIKRELPFRWVYSNAEEFDLPTVKLDEWLAKTLRSKAKTDDLPMGMIEFLVLEAKRAYYNTANPIMSDAQFDRIEALLKKHYPRSTALKVGADVETDTPAAQNEGGVAPEKVDLPYYMGSMNKMKDGVEGFKYVGPYVVTDKMDGISLQYTHDGKTARLYTRGNGSIGQDVTHLLKVLKLPKLSPNQAVRGELQFSKAAFKKYAKVFKNSRNMMSGMVNRKSISSELADASFVVFEQLNPRVKQSAALAKLEAQGFTVPWYQVMNTLTTKTLNTLLLDRKAHSPYEIDGLVITDDAKHPINKSGNPEWAFAFKSNAAFTTAEVTVVEVEWNVSRLGQVKPTVVFEPVELDGVTVSRATAHNAKYIVDNKIGPGAVLEVVRSGGVIPYIESVVKKSRRAQLPKLDWEWDKTGVNIIEKSGTSKNQKVTQLAFALKQLGVENVGIGQAALLYDLGITDIAELIAAKPTSYESIGPGRAKELFVNLKNALDDAHPVDLMVASGVFGMGIGSTKLESLLKQYPKFATLTQKQATLLDVPKGFSTQTYEDLCTQLPEFHAFLKRIGVKRSDMELEEVKLKSSKLNGKTFLFTGFRDADLEEAITENGGSVASGFSKSVTHLVVKDVGSSSSKAQAARKAGIPIITQAQARKMVG